jgi:hypothetical protein
MTPKKKSSGSEAGVPVLAIVLPIVGVVVIGAIAAYVYMGKQAKTRVAPEPRGGAVRRGDEANL